VRFDRLYVGGGGAGDKNISRYGGTEGDEGDSVPDVPDVL